MVGHLDGLVEGRTPELHVPVDGLDHLPEINAQVAEYFGEAPAQTKACEHTTQKDFCDVYHATDQKFSEQIHYWTTPQQQCVDGSGDNCTTYDEWVDKWQQIKG